MPTQIEGDFPGSAAAPKLTVLLVGAMALARTGLRRLLRGMEGVTIAGEEGIGPDGVAAAGRTEPDIVIIDAERIDERFMVFLDRLHHTAPVARSIILSDEDFGGKIAHALDLGMLGYLARDISQGELARAIRTVTQGRPIITGRLAPEVLTGLRMIRTTAAGVPLSLSRREMMVIREVADGGTDTQIARALGLSVPTVKSHVRSILKKTSTRNRTVAIAAAFRRGMLL